MCDKISTIILSEYEQTKSVLALYLDEFGQFAYIEDIADFSEAFITLSCLSKSLLLVDISLNSP